MAGSADVLLRCLREAQTNYKSQREMAHRIGVAPATLNRWLKGKKVPNPSLGELESIADELDMPVADLVSANGPPPKLRVVAATIDGAKLRRLLRKAADAIEHVADELPEGD